METTTQTLKKTRMSGSIQTSTPITRLGSVFRIDINNPNSFSQSFVFDKLLHLEKCPLVNPFVVFSCSSNSLQIFHNNNISTIQTFNNTLADVMITPSHKPFPSTREFSQLPLSRFCAFRLESRNKFIMLNPQLLNVLSIEFIVGCDCEFINSQVHPKNFTMLVRSYGAFSGECESEIIFFFRLSEQTFSNFPIKIFQSITRNFDRNFNSTINGGDAQNIIFKTETSRSIISDRNSIDNWIRLCFFNHSTRLFNTSDRKLRGQSHLPQILINKRMEFNIISNLHTPSSINTMLKSLFIQLNSFNYQIINLNLNWNTSNQHCKNTTESGYLNISESISPPKAEAMGIRNAGFI